MALGQRGGRGDQAGLTPDTEYRTTITSKEGLGDTHIFTGQVVDINLVNWTIDVYSQFDQMRFLDIPVASPYLHPNRGDGWFAVPEVGSRVVICWPGDSAPPFVLAFLPLIESEPMRGTEDAPKGTTERSDPSQTSGNATYSAGRPRDPVPGDQYWFGRDGQYVILRRGGILEIGANELSKRVYMPLTNLIMDFAENYRLHTSGGSVRWGLQEGEGKGSLPSEFIQTFRVFANDEYADIRVAAGKVHSPTPEPPGDSITDISAYGLGTDDPVVFEIGLATKGYRADNGALIGQTASLSKFRFFIDRAGGAFLRAEGNVAVNLKKKLRLRVEDDIEVFGGKNLFLSIEDDVRMVIGGTFDVTAGAIRFPSSSSSQPVARKTDQVAVALPPELVAAAFAPAPPSPTALSAVGVIVTGNPKVLA